MVNVKLTEAEVRLALETHAASIRRQINKPGQNPLIRQILEDEIKKYSNAVITVK